MTSTTFDAPARPRAAARPRALPLPRPELALLLAVAGVLNLWALSRNGWANDYYAGAVRAMSQSWHAFLYGSLDARGVMTVDKPPLALWVQALSVRAFGFDSWAMLVPQALMGVASVGLVYDLTRRRFGRAAGFAAGAVLALTPISVAISRHNNPDALLVLCVTAAMWAMVRALEDGRTRWVVLSGVCVGLGFEAKMGAALLVVPALAVAWLWMRPRGGRHAVGALAAGGAAMVAVGGAWPLLMALTPAADRPWISGTSDNSIWSLITGYNGLGRLDGQSGGPGGGMGGNAGPFGGSTGALRLLNDALGGQAGWLLGFALVAGLALAAGTRLRRADRDTGWVLAVGGAALTTAVAFSFASGIFHPYYVSALAPFTAALVGAGVVRFARGDNVALVAGPPAVAAGAITELGVLNESGTLSWLAPLLVAGGGLAAVALALGRRRLRDAALAGAIGLLLVAPAAWSEQTLGHATSSTFPAGGPASAASGFGGGPGGGAPGGAIPGRTTGAAPGGAGGFAPGGPGGFGADGSSLTAVESYIRSHGGGGLAVSSQSTAASALVSGYTNVVGIGGFSGRESEVTTAWLAQQVRAGRIRWVLADSGGFGMRNDGRVGASAVMAAVQHVGRQVTVNGTTLYDLGGQAAALAAA
jgi:4-amino-4-deoxy-L-arabinose transferase-like glycosyltransferase